MSVVRITTPRRLLFIITAVVLILLIPFIAMQFTNEVQWTASDFITMGTVLLGIGLAYELIARRSGKIVYRVAFGIGLLGAFLLFWVGGAVGIIGSEDQPANLLYGAVFLVGLVGSLVSRFKAPGMMRTLWIAGLVQLVIPFLAWMIWPDLSWGHAGMVRTLLLNAFFAVLFFVSGMLFRRALE